MGASPDDVLGLVYLARIVQEGSYTAAAKKLGVAKSAVSRRITALEIRLGTRLLNRTTRQVALTSDGERVYERAAALVAAADDAADSAEGSATDLRGIVRINAPVSLGMASLTDALAAFLQANPGVTIDLTLAENLVDVVAEGYDIAIRVRARMSDSSLVARKLGTTRLVAVASPAYLAARGAPAALDDLRDHNCLQYSLAAEPEWHTDAGDAVTIRGNWTTDSGAASRRAALAGLGITLLPCHLVDEDLAAGTLVPVLPGVRFRELGIWAVSAPGRLVPARVRAVVDHLAAHFSQPPPTIRADRARTPPPG